MRRDDQRAPRPGSIRCAIYTRKSTEEGLDQEFNTLDAQREACAAYVLSQRHEGWSLLPDYYDDGGYSGGNMNRPGLQRLLAEVRAGKVDVIVVYKVDRLTRALSDFSKIVDILDAVGASFVSITQAFNTTTSMGRLTLNVLLSFAQFEREVIGERVRDKVAASKRKGIWMGGAVPLGYDVVDRKLIINEGEAETVRHIFGRYLELRSVRELMAALAREGARTKVQTMRDGRTRGGLPFARAPLYWLLKNPIYVGQIRHHKAIYPGRHEPLLPKDMWDEVQALLETNAANRQFGTNVMDPSLLAGRISDGEGRPMVASHAKKGPRRYRYYISAPVSEKPGLKTLRLPAGEMESLVRQSIARLLKDTDTLAKDLSASGADSEIFQVIQRCSRRARDVPEMPISELRHLLSEMDVRVAVRDDRLEGSYVPRRLVGSGAPDAEQARFPLTIPGMITRRGHETRLIVPTDQAGRRRPNSRLVSLLVRSFTARTALIEEAPPSDMVAAKARKAQLSRVARMSYLAPDIVQAILEGTQPTALTARQMLRAGDMPISWIEQRRIFGFSEGNGYASR